MKDRVYFHKRGICLALKTFLFLTVCLLSVLLPVTPALAADPTLVTGAATDTTDSSTTLWGDLQSFGTYGGTYVYLSFDYATESYYNTHAFTYDRTTTEIVWERADGITSFSTVVSGLPNSTIFHFRAKVRFGNDFAYGLDNTFITSMLEPDQVPKIHFFKAYQDLLEPDDCLFVILGEIPYSRIPAIPVSRSYFWSLLDTGAEVGWNVGYAMNDNGYNFNVYAMYFEAADAIDWGNVADYTLALSGSPDVFSGVIPSFGVVDSPDYGVYADTWVTATDYKLQLGTDLLSIASTLEQEWQVVLLDEQDTKTVLSSNGEKLFRNAIPGVQQMAPAIFFVQRGTADVTNRAWGSSLGDTYKERLLGVDGLPGGGDDNWTMWGFVGMADWLNVPFLVIIGMLCIGLCAYTIYLAVRKWGTPVPGYIASLLIILCFSLLVMGLTVIALIGLFLVIMVGWLLFMRRG